MKRYAIITIAALVAILPILLISASSQSQSFSNTYSYLLALNGAVAFVLVIVVGMQLRGFWLEYRSKQFGTRLKKRLLLMFAAMAIAPGVIVYAVSLQFVVRSIDSWFDVRVDRALEGGVVLGQQALDYLVEDIKGKALAISLELDAGNLISSMELDQYRERFSVSTATLISANAQPLLSVSGEGGKLLPDLPNLNQLRTALYKKHYQNVDLEKEGSLKIRVVVPVGSASLSAEPVYLQLTQRVPESFKLHLDAVQETNRDYQQLVLSREGLNRIYTFALTMTFLLALLAALSLAFVLTRRLVAPLLILAEGTQAVSQGDFSPRQALPSRDELGVLTQSFNRMTSQLEEARAQAHKHSFAVESARAYLESVLANISTGVLAFDAEGSLRASNRGALTILQDALEDFENYTLQQWPRLHGFRDVLLKGLSQNVASWHEQFEWSRKDGTTQTLLIHGSRLPHLTTGGGIVIVFDDLTQLISAQRTAAWGEVARRMAHEIKNPLTPIQLSAERLAYKLSGKLDAENYAIVERATRTIVNQVEIMKTLVNAFRDYAKLPTPSLSKLQLNNLIMDLLNLYENADVQIELKLNPDLPLVMGDGAQLGQVLHNLLQNAQDALDGEDGGVIILETLPLAEHVQLNFIDNGPGFPVAQLEHAFEPYFTTKSRGTGLGLAIIKKIIHEHGGNVRLYNREEGGAAVSIKLRAVVDDVLDKDKMVA